LQLGGNDQWSNIIAGVELIRKKERKEAFGLTLQLLTTATGQKMGKTLHGAVFLDPQKTSPYDFYQFWRNTDDRDVIRYMKLLTFIPLEEIKEYEKLEGSELNRIKELLAYDITKNVHGEEAANKARDGARALFAGGGEGGQSTVPETQIEFVPGMTVIELLEITKLIPSRGEGRRLIEQGGIKLNGAVVESFAREIAEGDFTDGKLMLQKGKKVFLRVVKG
jgi:tyrosyl-tRNA synthetase